MTHQDRSAAAALLTLIILQLILLSTLYADIPPHPSIVTPLFRTAPFIETAIAAAFATAALLPISTGAGHALSFWATLMALVPFGAQEYFDAQFAPIWPTVIAGQLAMGTILFQAVRAVRNTPSDTDGQPFNTGTVQ